MVSYDISSDSVRRQVRERLKDFGTPVQYSVFECFLEPGQRAMLQRELSRLLEEDDSIRWYPLCRWCREKTVRQGCGAASGNPEYYLL